MFQVLAFIKYWLTQVDEHSLHSPFVFELYNEIIKKASASIDPKIEQLRDDFKKDSAEIELVDYGAGSRVNSSSKRTIAEITKNASTPAKFSALLKKLIEYLEYQRIYELGTSLGFNTLYLSEVDKAKVTTFEGDPSLSRMAKTTFSNFGKENITLIEGDLDKTLKEHIEGVSKIDLAYVDANHLYEPTLLYYEILRTKCHPRSLIVLDDIHWSKEMNKAWHDIKNRPEVIVSIDLFEAGLLFFDPTLTPGEYVLKF